MGKKIDINDEICQTDGFKEPNLNPVPSKNYYFNSDGGSIANDTTDDIILDNIFTKYEDAWKRLAEM